ncbi:PEP/pyruvate-binding domain-containing protein [Brevibacillus choshinensis]|uniref:PEP/pyruvate-binding domain-containing protein n=1 Tax=Brevibacillus choshinensis TaxID=54911 RepID=UPI002E21A295|nr:PEP/pyruvate-binding domain-containing protein [Brevibacillus choshinensis]
MYTVALQSADQEDILRVGTKAFQLAQLVKEKFRVPPGFIVTSNALARFLLENHLEEKVWEATVPSEIERDIAAAFEQLKAETNESDLSVAVRSSSAAEDLQGASFAGQYESILNVKDFPHLMDSVKMCWSSLFSDRVKQYAQQKKIAVENYPMAVLIQRCIEADVSGVVFSMNPVTQNKEEIVINASYGLGEAIVSGIVTPDSFVVSKQLGNVRKELGCKEMKMVYAQTGVKEAETTMEEQDRFCLTDEQLLSLVNETKKLESFYQHPVDIEFAIKADHIYILQARPVTT